MWVYLNQQFVEDDKARISVFDRGSTVKREVVLHANLNPFRPRKLFLFVLAQRTAIKHLDLFQ